MQGRKLLAKNVLCVYSPRPVVRIRPGGKWCSVNVCTPFSLPHNTSSSHRKIGKELRQRDYIAQKECICLRFSIGRHSMIWGGGVLSTNSHTLTKFWAASLKHTKTGQTHTLFSHPMIFTMPSSDVPEQNYKLHYNDVPRMRRYCGCDVPRGSNSSIKNKGKVEEE